eukprot:CAMPEP_0201547926 /NCGR_PEP_ID=MMETSP0173_2-20130828/4421_1 /ASSEMBLY_ACC=CAM_ASM_000268 /TAXON_ID=218659 /ORGANISM="Vexillifera sp., Strain DIVA3 564/2" /LENGTH=70 /DNA_ID=CAMNT_0047957121 /DNA_START=16 /DNA_END=228 /DNA_ORIENTATION=+
MSAAWQKAGWSFLRYTNTAASMVRRSLKPEFRVEAMKRDTPIVTLNYYEGGKPKELLTEEQQRQRDAEAA